MFVFLNLLFFPGFGRISSSGMYREIWRKAVVQIQQETEEEPNIQSFERQSEIGDLVLSKELLINIEVFNNNS